MSKNIVWAQCLLDIRSPLGLSIEAEKYHVFDLQTYYLYPYLSIFVLLTSYVTMNRELWTTDRQVSVYFIKYRIAFWCKPYLYSVRWMTILRATSGRKKTKNKPWSQRSFIQVWNFIFRFNHYYIRAYQTKHLVTQWD